MGLFKLLFYFLYNNMCAYNTISSYTDHFEIVQSCSILEIQQTYDLNWHNYV